MALQTGSVLYGVIIGAGLTLAVNNGAIRIDLSRVLIPAPSSVGVTNALEPSPWIPRSCRRGECTVTNSLGSDYAPPSPFVPKAHPMVPRTSECKLDERTFQWLHPGELCI